ncbi:hypothetical protein MYAM1_001444 [Malassezia yamatoensis]|uniref:Trafficking protein particle complex subunit 13 n=1 Tax=Malassezia yamatoensis TaxID=253288 RepID=A0AAJ6CFX1_9BASI|nr:hypothetical protein MYAM1_001444 [Malassezia yamatoensis]
MAAETNVAPLAVKVMRISAPLFAKQNAPYFENGLQKVGDAAGKASFDPSIWQDVSESFGSAQSVPSTLVDAMARDASLSDIITLPPSFGAVAMGEIFSVLICVINESDRKIDGVHLQVDMQSNANDPSLMKELNLAHAPASEKSGNDSIALCALEPYARMSAVARHEIQSATPHSIVCRVRYNAELETKEAWMSKVYKFNVHPSPIQVYTTVHGSRAGALDFSLKDRERTFVQVQVQNISTKPIVIENVATADLWECEVIEHPDTECSTKHLLPNDVMQFVLILTPSDPDTIRLKSLEQLEAAPLDHREVAVAHTLGSLGIDWRIPSGEKGSWRSPAIMKRTKRAASVLCEDFAGSPRLVTQYAYQKPEKVTMLSASLIGMRIIIDDLNTLREAGRDTSWQKQIVLEAIPDTWTEMSLLGPQRIKIIPNESFTIQVVPLHDGIVRAGGMVLKLYASEDHSHSHGSRVLKKWQCLFELLAEKTVL